MREILFRGKDTETGEWRYSMTIARQCYDDNEIFSYYIGAGYRTIDGKTLGQFTGLTDRNGKRIFEGDICLCDRNINDHIDRKKFIVEFEPLRGWIGVSKDGWSEFDGSAWECAEIIGNIHDNPEL